MIIEGTRKQSLGNIYNQQKSSYSTPTSNSSGALDNLMADLMNSMNDDIHLSSSPIPTSTKHASNHCAVCHEEFDYRDVVKQAGQKVMKISVKCNNKTNSYLVVTISVTTRLVLFAACVALHLINVVRTMNMKVNFIVREIFMWSKIVSCVVPGKWNLLLLDIVTSN